MPKISKQQLEELRYTAYLRHENEDLINHLTADIDQSLKQEVPVWEDEVVMDAYYKTPPNHNGRVPTLIQWIKFFEAVKAMRNAQKEQKTPFDFNTIDEFDSWAEDAYEKQCDLEAQVDRMIEDIMEI